MAAGGVAMTQLTRVVPGKTEGVGVDQEVQQARRRAMRFFTEGSLREVMQGGAERNICPHPIVAMGETE